MWTFFNRWGAALQVALTLLMAAFGCGTGTGTLIVNFGEIYVEDPGWVEPVVLPIPVADISTPSPPAPKPIPRPARPELPVPDSPVRAEPLRNLNGHVYFLSSGYSWVRGKPTKDEPPEIEFLGQVQAQERIRDYFASSGLQNQIRQATDLVAIGLSSCEGQLEIEHGRAQKRAHWLHNQLQQCHPEEVDLPHLRYWIWNWGRFGERCPEDTLEEETRHQRSVMVIAVQGTPGEPLDEDDLVAEMERLSVLPVRIQDYRWRDELVPVNF